MEQLKYYNGLAVSAWFNTDPAFWPQMTPLVCTTVSFADTSHWHQRWIVWYIKMWYNDLLICTIMRLTCKLGKDVEYSVLGFELCVNLRHVNYWWLNMISKMNDLRVCSYQNRELTQLIRKSFLKNVTGREGDLQFCINFVTCLVGKRPSVLHLCYWLPTSLGSTVRLNISVVTLARCFFAVWT
jgi:hypothetical protein